MSAGEEELMTVAQAASLVFDQLTARIPDAMKDLLATGSLTLTGKGNTLYFGAEQHLGKKYSQCIDGGITRRNVEMAVTNLVESKIDNVRRLEFETIPDRNTFGVFDLKITVYEYGLDQIVPLDPFNDFAVSGNVFGATIDLPFLEVSVSRNNMSLANFYVESKADRSFDVYTDMHMKDPMDIDTDRDWAIRVEGKESSLSVCHNGLRSIAIMRSVSSDNFMQGMIALGSEEIAKDLSKKILQSFDASHTAVKSQPEKGVCLTTKWIVLEATKTTYTYPEPAVSRKLYA
jgi:hypothetical protein